uniref:Neprosin PEP catalytic domain-containing protein n=1 Tax=Vitis vinifera TaxID=29760 RepID=F6HJN7_VITVI
MSRPLLSTRMPFLLRRISAIEVCNLVGHQHAVVYVEGDKNYGVKATINVWEPKIQQPNEFSLSQLWILRDSFGENLNSIEAVWQTREHTLLAFTLGVKEIIRCCNEMYATTPKYSKAKMFTRLAVLVLFMLVVLKQASLNLVSLSPLDQMECYCEALVQETEENQKQMLGELQNLIIEHSTCVYAISSTKAQMETMNQDMNEQILRFAEDGHDLDSLN